MKSRIELKRIERDSLATFADESKWKNDGASGLVRELGNGARFYISRYKTEFLPMIIYVNGNEEKIRDEEQLITSVEDAKEVVWDCYRARLMEHIANQPLAESAKVEWPGL
jgi:hypothetical protein